MLAFTSHSLASHLLSFVDSSPSSQVLFGLLFLYSFIWRSQPTGQHYIKKNLPANKSRICMFNPESISLFKKQLQIICIVNISNPTCEVTTSFLFSMFRCVMVYSIFKDTNFLSSQAPIEAYGFCLFWYSSYPWYLTNGYWD